MTGDFVQDSKNVVDRLQMLSLLNRHRKLEVGQTLFQRSQSEEHMPVFHVLKGTGNMQWSGDGKVLTYSDSDTVCVTETQSMAMVYLNQKP